MKTVGHRKLRTITFHASGEALLEGARFNEEMQKLPTGGVSPIPKGVYFFKTHEEAYQHQLDCLAKGMAKVAWERINGRNK